MDFEHPRHLVNVRDPVINETIHMPRGAKVHEQGGQAALFNVGTSLVHWNGIRVYPWQPLDQHNLCKLSIIR